MSSASFVERQLGLLGDKPPLDVLRATPVERPYTHPERGPETLAKLLRLWAGHDLSHLDAL